MQERDPTTVTRAGAASIAVHQPDGVIVVESTLTAVTSGSRVRVGEHVNVLVGDEFKNLESHKHGRVTTGGGL